LNALAKNPEIDKPFLWNLYILAFVYRNTSRFEAIVTECQLLQVHERKQENESAANDSNPFIKAATNLPTLREYKILNLRNETASLENRVSQLAKNLTSSFVGPQCKRYEVYKSVYNKSLSAKCNVTELLKKISVEQNLTYESLRRGYFRWKNDYASSFIMGETWPTAEFNYFCALLSVVFLPDNQASPPLFYLNESIIFEVTRLRKALRESSQDIFMNERLKQQYDKLNEDQKNTPQKQKKMIELAGKNYLPAVQYCRGNSSSRHGRKYWLQSAILGDTNAQKHCQWKAAGLQDIKLEVASEFKAAEKFLGEENLAVSFEGKYLTEQQQEELVDIIHQNSNVHIICIMDKSPEQENKSAERSRHHEERQQNNDKERNIHSCLQFHPSAHLPVTSARVPPHSHRRRL
jgi:hypothetical protein